MFHCLCVLIDWSRPSLQDTGGISLKRARVAGKPGLLIGGVPEGHGNGTWDEFQELIGGHEDMGPRPVRSPVSRL